MLTAGFKDTFGIFAGERVRVLIAPQIAGLFMYHCHNLEHEDGGIAITVLIEQLALGGCGSAAGITHR